MIFGNGLKKFDFARQNLDGRAKCLAQKNEKKHCYRLVERTVGGLEKLIFCPISHWPVFPSIFQVRGRLSLYSNPGLGPIIKSYT